MSVQEQRQPQAQQRAGSSVVVVVRARNSPGTAAQKASQAASLSIHSNRPPIASRCSGCSQQVARDWVLVWWLLWWLLLSACRVARVGGSRGLVVVLHSVRCVDSREQQAGELQLVSLPRARAAMAARYWAAASIRLPCS